MKKVAVVDYGMGNLRSVTQAVVHAAAIVRNFDPVDPAADKRNRDLGRAGIDRVFHQFLQRRSRSFHHFTGGDAIDEMRRQPAY